MFSLIVLSIFMWSLPHKILYDLLYHAHTMCVHPLPSQTQFSDYSKIKNAGHFIRSAFLLLIAGVLLLFHHLVHSSAHSLLNHTRRNIFFALQHHILIFFIIQKCPRLFETFVLYSICKILSLFKYFYNRMSQLLFLVEHGLLINELLHGITIPPGHIHSSKYIEHEIHSL